MIILIIITLIITNSISYSNELTELPQQTAPIVEDESPKLVNIDYHIYTDGDISEEYIDMAIQEIEKAKFYKNDYSIIITDYYLDGTDLEENKRVVGQTDYTNKIIYVHHFDINGTLLHEIGHAVDDTYNLSVSAAFREIYMKVNKAELNKQEAYYVSNEREYFADCYEKYINKTIFNENILNYFKNLEAASL